jgi:outer membrane protein TolC
VGKLWIWLAALLAGCGSPRRPAEPAPYHAPPAPAPERRSDGPLTIAEAVDVSLRHYPAIRAALARGEAAQAGIDVAGAAYYPRLDFVWQSLRSTRNNLSGTLLPTAVVPGLSGPVSNERSWDSAWGSAAGVLFSIEPFDFGFRGSAVEVARQLGRQSRAETELTRLDVAAGALDAFLARVAAEQTLRALAANLERWEVFARSVRALADRELRPGADASRADAEAAAARSQLILAQQTFAVSQAVLSEALGGQAAAEVDPAPLFAAPPADELPPVDVAAHPVLLRQSAAIEASRAREEALANAFAPRVGLHFAFNDRGTGFEPDGSLGESDDGLYPDRFNWVAGLTITLSALDYYTLRDRRRVEEANTRAERARADQAALQLRGQEARVRAALDAARRIALNTPVQLQAAREAQTRARARYDTGLGTLTEVAEAQRLLVGAEIDDALARLSLWRALAAAARVQGDVRPFLGAVARSRKEK